MSTANPPACRIFQPVIAAQSRRAPAGNQAAGRLARQGGVRCHGDRLRCYAAKLSPCNLGNMRRIELCAIAIAAFAPAWASPAGADKAAASAISAARPGTKWDRTTLVSGDFNGDGLRDWAMVGYQGSGLELAIRVSGGKTGKTRTQLLAFGIGASMQAAICEAPAKLQVDLQFCNPMDDALPGCRPSKLANSLSLSGGDCDSIHLYWNSDAKRMEWWRQ